MKSFYRASATAFFVAVLVNNVNAVFTGPCNSYEAEKKNEGYFRCAYTDPFGLRTVGVGFNLEKSGARQRIASVGADYDKVKAGSQCLTDAQIQTLFVQDMDSSVSCVSNWLPNWSSLTNGPKSAVADMAFNLGCAGVQGFAKMKVALTRSPPNYTEAAAQMRNSRWCSQVGGRCTRDINCMVSS
eukprot:Em0001g1388a